ncbi:MAG: hypothetical protein HY318_05100, partial [Armatimonadetes bacterium]|nr:hypothetical protein [Armatimonadota bacterium]
MWTVPIVFMATLCLSFVLDAVGRRSSPAKDAVDPGPIVSPLPGLLGWGVVAAGVAALWWYVPGTRAEEGPLLQVAGLLAGSWVIGRACDRFPIPREVRLGLVLLLSIAASVFAAFDAVKAPFSARFIPLGVMSQPLTALWIFIVAYAFFGTNLIPGLALGLTGVISATLLAIGLLQPQTTGSLAMMLTTPLAGFSLGQWNASRSPDARRMDSGTALSLGFALALITVAGALKNTAFLVLILPMLVLGTPLIDVTYAILRKPKGEILKGEAVTLQKARLRLHDVLLQEAVPLRKVTSLLIALDGYLCLLALLLVLMIRVHFAFKLLLMLPALVVGGLFFYSLSKLFARKAAALPGDKINLLNVAISPLSMSEALERVEEYIASRQPHMIVTSDTSLIVKAQDDPEFFRIVNEADMVTADGIGVVL